MDICIPPDTDWSCRWTDDEFTQQLEDDDMARKIANAEAFAWSLLAALCAYRIGTCPITVRPCAERCLPTSGTYRTAIARGGNVGALGTTPIGAFNPHMTGGTWVNACGCRPGGCGCENLSTVILPGPVGSVVRVRLDGADLPRSAYKVMNGNRLVRTDGEEWPGCQDMALDDADGFSVTYYRGAAPNRMTKAAAGVLANEFLLACDGDAACRLPSNLTSMARSGEQYEFDQVDYDEGNTGIPEVQALIRIYNPHHLKSPVIVASPDDYLVSARTA